MKIAILLVMALAARSGDHPAPPKASKELERMKALAGTWKGEGEMEGKKEKIVVTYKVTSAGSAVVETTGPGTPHEMVSVYHDAGGKLMMTHYCAAGNQPRMALKKATAQALALEYAKSEGINPKKDMHMHGLTVAWLGPDSIEQRWTSWSGGKEMGAAVFRLKKQR